MIYHVAVWLLKSLAVFLVSLPITLCGLLLVGVALPFRKTHADTSQPFTQFPGSWELVTLPTWAKLWSNEFDGALGDKRGWWNDYCLTNYNKPCTAFYSMWQWLAVRNPSNYWSRVVTGCDTSLCNITKLAGDDEVEEVAGKWQWQFLCATNKNDFRFHRLYCVFPWWFDSTHCVMIDIGWKIKLKHNLLDETDSIKDRVKGSVFALSPWKAL